MRLALKRQIGKFWPTKSQNRKIILLYHSVGNSPWALPHKVFSDQINWIHDHFQVTTLTNLLHAPSLNNELQVAITFDDGYVSLYDHVAPIMAEKKIRPTVYINTGWIGESENNRKLSVAKLGHYPEESFLTWTEVKALYQAGWEIGSHGVNHYNFAQLDPDVLKQELSLSKRHIEDQISTPCLHIAYPWGRYSRQVKQACSRIGYQYAAAAYHSPLGDYPDLFSFPRMNISIEYTFDDFKKIIQGKWDYLGLIHKMRGL